MRPFLKTLILTLTISTPALAADITTLSGTPDGSLSFIQRMVIERAGPSVGRGYEDYSTTWAYSVLRDVHVRSAIAVEVLDAAGAASHDALNQALTLAADERSPVVFSNVGPLANDSCALMASHPRVAFVVVSGSDSVTMTASERPACTSRNILFVAALNQRTYQLEPYTNWGAELVRVAAPSHRIGAVGVGGAAFEVSNTTMGTALVAGRLAIYARERSELRGAALISRFLENATVPVPALTGQVREGRVLPQ